MKSGYILVACLLLTLFLVTSAGASDTGRMVRNGSTIFVYEQDLNLTGIHENDSPRFLFHYSSLKKSRVRIDNVIPTFIPQSVNLNPSAVRDIYGGYYVYSENFSLNEEIGYVYIDNVELTADVVLIDSSAGSANQSVELNDSPPGTGNESVELNDSSPGTGNESVELNDSSPGTGNESVKRNDSSPGTAYQSVDGQTVTRNQTLSVEIRNNLASEFQDDRPPVVIVCVTLPGGNRTPVFGDANMTEIPLTANTVYTDAVAGPINLSDAPEGTYDVIVQWPRGSDFYGRNLNSNKVSFTVVNESTTND